MGGEKLRRRSPPARQQAINGSAFVTFFHAAQRFAKPRRLMREKKDYGVGDRIAASICR